MVARSGNTTILANGTVNTQCNALAELLNGGFIDILDGSQPDAADLPVTSQTVGVTMAFGDPAFRPAVAGTIVSNMIQPGVAVASIKPAWARMYMADRRTVVMDISVGVRDANLIVPADHIEKGATLSLDKYTHTIAKTVDRTWRD